MRLCCCCCCCYHSKRTGCSAEWMIVCLDGHLNQHIRSFKIRITYIFRLIIDRLVHTAHTPRHQNARKQTWNQIRILDSRSNWDVNWSTIWPYLSLSCKFSTPQMASSRSHWIWCTRVCVCVCFSIYFSIEKLDVFYFLLDALYTSFFISSSSSSLKARTQLAIQSSATEHEKH